MSDKKNKVELVTFMSNPENDKGIKLRAKMSGKTKSGFYRELISEKIKTFEV